MPSLASHNAAQIPAEPLPQINTSVFSVDIVAIWLEKIPIEAVVLAVSVGLKYIYWTHAFRILLYHENEHGQTTSGNVIVRSRLCRGSDRKMQTCRHKRSSSASSLMYLPRYSTSNIFEAIDARLQRQAQHNSNMF